MSKTYRSFAPDQMFLMPPSLVEWLPKNHLVFFVRDVLEKIDLSPITSVYEREERGYPPYHPKMMTGILLYGYCNGIASSRKLAKRCEEDIAFRVLAANSQPDFRTISDFRKRHLEALQHLFLEILSLCRKAGLVKFGHIALDGTKMKANASLHKAMSYGRMQQETARLKQEIAQLLKQAERVDRHEDRQYGQDKRGDELPEELARRESRLAKIEEAKRALEEEARRNNDDCSPSSGSPSSKIKTERKGKSGKERPAHNAQRNFTDPDSRVMPYQRTFVQGYNGQLAVDGAHQIIVATDVTNYPKDDAHLAHMIDQLPRTPKVLTADAGYCSDENLRLLRRKKKMDAYIAVGRENYGTLQQVPVRGRPPKTITLRERMRRKLLTRQGQQRYARRKAVAEPPIGHIKHVLGFRQFSLRGQAKARGEWFLITTAHNLKKLFTACLAKPKRRLVLAT